MRILTFLLIAVCSLTFVNQAGNWTFQNTTNGIEVYTQPYLKLEKVKAVTTVKASPSSLLAVLDDFDSYGQWVYNCKVANLTKRVSERESYYYTRVDAGMMGSDRDVVTHVKVSQNSSTKAVTVSMDAANNQVAKKSGVVRIEVMEGYWKFTPKGNGTTKIEYVNYADPGGASTSWIARSTTKKKTIEAAVYTVGKLKQMAVKSKYQNASYSYIAD